MNQKVTTMSSPKGFAPILIVILIALIVGGYLFYQKQTKPVPQPVAQPSSNSAVSPAPNDAGETANWKTYTNKKNGYSFKYPSNWSDITSQEDQQIGHVSLEIGIKDQKYYFKVGLVPTLGGISTAYDVNSYDFKDGKVSYSGIIALKEGVPSLISVTPDNPYSVGGRIQIFFPPAQSDVYVKIFDQILSTFRFTN